MTSSVFLRRIAVGAVASLTVVLAACGSSSEGSESTPAAGGQTSAASSEASSAAPSAPAGSSSGAAPSSGAASSSAAGSGAAEPTSGGAALDPQCGQDTRTIKHDLGETEIKGTPSKIVALEFSFADDLASIDVKPVGIADDGDSSRIIPEVAEKIGDYTSVGKRQSPSLQNIAALQPDLIIADSSRHKDIYDQLKAIAPTLELPANKATLQDNLDAARLVGLALNKCQEMADRIAQNASTLAKYGEQLPGDVPPVLFGVGSDKSLTIHNAAGYLPSVLVELGLKYLLPADPSNPQAEESEETLVTQNPAILFVASTEKAPTIFDQWAKDPVGSQIQAVKDGKVFKVDSNLWSRAKGITASEVVAAEVVQLLGGS
ncbi:MAG TPA: Fe(3+) dicitrate ABC transporter substrate-binding protein [Nakamurella sp.]|nr:Fe(3+) dicitrate ABC transporter substrate-binding protein [Nakamurella sp.]